MLSKTLEVRAGKDGVVSVFLASIHQTNDAPTHWGFSIVDPTTGGRLYQTLYGLGSGLEEKLTGGAFSFSGYELDPDSAADLYRLSVALGAMKAPEAVLPPVQAPGPRLRLSAFAERGRAPSGVSG